MTHTAFASGSSEQVAAALVDRLASARGESALVAFFAHVDLDGRAIGDALRREFVDAPVIGCSANGVFASAGYAKSGCTAIAIPRRVAPRAAATLVRLGYDVDASIAAGGRRLSAALGRSIRELDYDRHVGLVLVEGASQREELVNQALGDIAPALRCVGGSAGDDIKFERTWAYCDGELAQDGCAVSVLEMSAPFTIVQGCNFECSDRVASIDEIVPGTRIIRRIDGRPAAEFFAELAGKAPHELTFVDFLTHPLGLVIDGRPWLRSGVRVVEDGGVLFACSMVEGARLHVMTARDLVDDTRAQLAQVRSELGGDVGGAVLFNCAYRMLEAQIRGVEAAYHEVLGAVPHAGFHTNGESYLGHINQTLTGLAYR